MSVTFSNIPQTLYEPLFYVEFSNVQAGVNQQVQPALLIGQSLLGSSPEPEFVPSAQWASQYFGSKSMLARMAKTYFASDPVGPLYALPLNDNPAGATATIDVLIQGTATGNGTIWMYVAGILVPVGVQTGQTPAQIAANLVAAGNASIEPLPGTFAVSSSGAIAIVTFTSAHNGALSNLIDIRFNYLGAASGQVFPSGVSVTTNNLMAGNSDPDLGGVAAAIADQPFDFIMYPYGIDPALFAEMTAVMSDQSGRWAWNRQSYGHCFTMAPGPNAASPTNFGVDLETVGATMNDQHQTFVGVQNPLNPPWDWVADWGGTVAPSIRALASRPLQTLELSTCVAPATADWFNFSTREQLLGSGIALPSFSTYGGPQILRSVTTYQRNSESQPDQSYLDCETLFTLMAITRQLKAALLQKYPRAILVPDGTRVGSGQPVISPKIALAEIANQYLLMEQNLLVTSAAQMLAATVVQINAQNPSRLDILWAPYLANGLRIIAMVNQFRLNANA